MSSNRIDFSASAYERERERQTARYSMGHDEFDSAGYQAPTLSDPKTGMSDYREETDLPEDEFAAPNAAESFTSGAASTASRGRGGGGGGGGDGFVTELPRTRRGLTGKISTLFRRESSRERAVRQASGGIPPGDGVRRKKAMKSGGEKSSRSRRKSGDNSSHASSVREDDAHDHISLGSRSQSQASHSSGGSQRIFYSSHADDGSDDSYESRGSRKMKNQMRSQSPETLDTGADSTGSGKTIVRYRGFSTSIKSLFLDETVVCAAMGCFGLILSNRTEYLLNLRNERRGALKRHQNIERKKLPSRIVAYGLLVTIILMFATFAVWGTGDGLAGSHFFVKETVENGADDLVFYDNNNGNDDYYGYNDDNQYDQNQNNDDANNNQYNNNQYNNNQYNDNQYNNNQYNNNQYNNNQYNNNQYNNNQYNNNQYNDDGNANNNDDANNNNNDDANKNNNDDANNNYNAYQQANNYNAYNAYQDANNYNAYNAYNAYNGGNRRVEEGVDVEIEIHPHQSFNGIFKLRDYHDNVWHPTVEFIRDEWDLLLDLATADGAPPRTKQHRFMEDNQADNYGNYNAANYNSENEETTSSSYGDLASNIRFALLFTFLLFLGFLGRRRRMRTRFYLVRARAQEDHLFYASTQVGDAKRVKYENSREDQYEGACSHTLCGWYPSDEVVEEEEVVDSVEVTDSGIFKRKKKHHNEDVVARIFNFLMSLCCGFACKCWFQCMSVCALAQEAREIRLLVPPRYQRIDYITHQPFHEYQKDVNDLRRGWMGKSRKKAGIRPHWNALSRLSRYILVTFILAICTIVASLIFNPRVGFSWPDVIVLSATFVQSFLVLFIVHGIFHKSDLSLDAVIKMFAAGFLIATPSAFFFEGIMANTFLSIGYSLYVFVTWLGGEPVSEWIFNNWHILWFLGELFNAYVVAAVTEELCKYYTFRTVEHPDLVFLTGLTRTRRDESAVEGGLVKYPFASHQVQELNRTGSFGDLSQYSHRSNQSKKSRTKPRDMKLIERTGTMEEEFDEDETDVRTYRQKAMAITTGMIGVAVGLACAENFLYVFVFGGTATQDARDDDRRNVILEQWIILVFRSIYPIHALAAALQSINMIRKFVEGDGQNGHRIGVGRILLPAVLLHGTFDAILMAVNFYQENAWISYLKEHNGNVDPDEAPYNQLFVNIAAWAGITSVMMAGIIWYYRENRRQRDRLKILEEKVKARMARGEDSSWDSPTGHEDDEHNIV